MSPKNDQVKVRVNQMQSIAKLLGSLLEASLAAATVLITVGVMLGKLNPLQMLFLGLAETPVYVFNSYIGYKIFGANDAGEA